MTADIDWDAELADVEPEVRESNVLHRTGTSRTGTTGRRGRRSTKRIDTLQKKLSGEMFQAGTIIGFALPVTGYYACQESDNFTKAVVELAQSKAEWLEALERVANIGPGITIGRTIMGLGAAMAVDRGRVSPDKTVLQLLGVTSAYLKVHPPENVESGNGYRPPPAEIFIPVT